MSSLLPMRVVAIAVAGISCWLALIAGSQTYSFSSSLRQEQGLHEGKAIGVYEDDEVRIRVPQRWIALKAGHPDDPLAPHPPAVPSTFIPPPGRGVLLSSKGYTLTLAYSTGHNSPILGGRFIDLFNIPWLADLSDEWQCGDYLRKVLRPADGLSFVSLTLDQPSAEIHRMCQIPENVVVRHRWFAGYFTTPDDPRDIGAKGNYARYFFKSEGPNCAEKAYTLTTDAKTPDALPDLNDPTLRKVTAEAIEIVTHIHYKRCAPAGMRTE